MMKDKGRGKEMLIERGRERKGKKLKQIKEEVKESTWDKKVDG